MAASATLWLFLICFVVWLGVSFILALRLSVSSRNSFKYTLFVLFWFVLALFWFGLFLCFYLQLLWLICNFLKTAAACGLLYCVQHVFLRSMQVTIGLVYSWPTLGFF
jgi:hypothetical protein